MKHAIQKVVFALCVALLLFSSQIPYWKLKVTAPQYPKGLVMTVYVNRVSGDIQEINILNHYIGMRRIDLAADWEKKLAMPFLIMMSTALLVASFLRPLLQLILSIPALVFPFCFVADLYWWIRNSGLNLDPRAPLSSSVKPFIPPLMGHGKIAQFEAFAQFGLGFYLILAVALFISAALIIRFRSKTIKPVLIGAAAMLFFLLQPSLLQAKTWEVSPQGPYREIQAVLDQSDKGDVIIVQGGSHSGPIEIRQSVKLLAKNHAMIDGHGKGTVVKILAPDVTLGGFHIRNSGDVLSQDDAGIYVRSPNATIVANQLENVLFGIYLSKSSNSIVKHNTLKGKPLDTARQGDLIRIWYSDHLLIEDNAAEEGRDSVIWFSKRSVIRRNQFKNSRYGIHLMYCSGAVVEENRLENNSVGIYLMYSSRIRLRKNRILNNRGPSGYGIGFKDMDRFVIEKNVIAGNKVGFYLDGAGNGIHRKNFIGYNDLGLILLPSSRNNRFYWNSFSENSEQIQIEGAAYLTQNLWFQNYWSDYRGPDLNRDGIGDSQYQSVKFFESLSDRYPMLRFFRDHTVAKALEFATHLFPIFSPQAKFQDPAPLVKDPTQLEFKDQTQRNISWPWFLMAGTLAILPMGMRKKIKIRFHLQKSNHPKDNRLPMITVKQLTKRFGSFKALTDLSFELKAGETLVLWGPNGAGKTTVLKCLLGIIPFNGHVSVLGKDVLQDGKWIRRRIGYVPQDIRFCQDQSVAEAVAFYAAFKKVPKKEAEELMAQWKLNEFLHKKIGSLSGGMKQKLTLVIALLGNPDILMLDESTNHLDLKAREEFVSHLRTLKKQGKTMILCSHRPYEITQLADRILILEQGIKVREGTPDDLRTHLGGSTSVLCLRVAPADSQKAYEFMKDNGFRVTNHEYHLCVEILETKKIDLLKRLLGVPIEILDFDWEPHV